MAEATLSNGGTGASLTLSSSVTNCATCQIFTAPKPLARFNTSREAAVSSFEAAKSSLRSHRVFIDEGADDLVIIGDGEVMFHRIALAKAPMQQQHQQPPSANARLPAPGSLPLRSSASSNALDQRQASTAFGESGSSIDTPPEGLLPPNAAAGVVNTVHLRTARRKAIRFAKRCPAPSAVRNHHPSYMVAVVHDETNVDVYLPLAPRLDRPRWAGSDANETEPTDSFAVWSCRPNNLRFGSKAYPIRSVAWSVGPESALVSTGGSSGGSSGVEIGNSFASTGSSGGAHYYGPGSFASTGGAASVPAVTYAKFLIVLSEIAIDLVQVSDRPGTDPLVLAKRIITRIDHWSFDVNSHVFTLVNKAKLGIVKPFVADRANVVRALPQIKLSDVAEMSASSTATSQMDSPALNVLVQPLTIGGRLYVAHLNMRNELVLYRWVPEVSSSSGAGSTAGSSAADDAARRNAGLPASSAGDDAGQGGPAGGAGVGNFEKAYVLALQESGGCVRLQVIDNLLITHWPQCAVSTAFDLSVIETIANAAAKCAGSSLARHSDPNATGGGGGGGGVAPSPSPTSRSSIGWRDKLRGARASTDVSAGSGAAAGDLLRPTTMVGPMYANHELDCMTGSFATAPTLAPQSSVPAAAATTKSLRQPTCAIAERIDAAQPALSPDGEMSSDEFYNGSLPLILDRRHGKVSLLCVDPAAMATSIKDLCSKTQFLLNRCEAGGSAVPRMVYKLLSEQEPLGVVAQVFDIIAEESARLHKLHKANAAATSRKGLPYGLPSPYSRAVIGACRDVAPILPILTTDETLRAAEERSVLTFDDAMRLLVPSAVAAARDGGWVGRGYVDQQSLYHFVFAPLAQRAFAPSDSAARGDGTSSSTAPSPPQWTPSESITSLGGGASGSTSTLPPSGGMSDSEQREQAQFAKYVLAALIEYTRALVQRGLRLSDALQQLLIHGFVSSQAAGPDLFRFHQMLMYRAIEDHVVTAQRLMRMQSAYPPAFQLGLDMLSRLDKPHIIVDEFLASNMVLRAAKFIVENRVRNAGVMRVLQRAVDNVDIKMMEQAAAKDRYGEHAPEAKAARKALETAAAEFCTAYQLLTRHLRLINETADGLVLLTRRYDDLCARGL